MNSAEQTVTWLITLGVLESPKKTISDPEGFLQSSLKDGVVLCKLVERLRPGSVEKIFQEPRNDSEFQSNIKEFLKGCGSFRVEVSHLTCLLLCNFVVNIDNTTGGQRVLVRAKFTFQQTNEDELSFNKGDMISVSRQEDGGWWEGSFNGNKGWFPSNYVKEVKGSDNPVSPKSGTLKNPVLQNILETETEYSKELQSLLTSYLHSLQPTDKLSSADVSHILGNLEDISTFQLMLVQSYEECTRLPESQQRVGGFFLNLLPQMKALYMAYCSNHPSAVNILTEHSEELGEFMEGKGASSPGILTLTTGLSKPFMRLDKYPTLLKELERHMEEHHPDRPDIQKCLTSFKSLSAQCQEVRKRKELELQILTETIRRWEGDDIRTLGPVLYMSHTLCHTHGSEEKNERYLLLFPNVLLLLSASSRMSGFIYQVGISLVLALLCVCVTGSTCERMQVVCNNQQDLQEWVEHLSRHTQIRNSRGVSAGPAYHTLPHPSSHGVPQTPPMWGPLEPPSTPKPWSLSCLRPAPPLKPSAALCYKEVWSWDLSKSPKSMKKLLPKRKPERKASDEDFATRKSTAALEEDAQILKVIEAYCTSAKTRQTLNSRSREKSGLHMLFPEEEKIIVEETKSNGQTVIEEKTLVDTVYGLKDEVQELKQDNKKMRRTLDEEQKARKELEKILRRVLKNMNDPTWDETNL
uniref:Osteoclast-stimulating factor 1 n=1 Tax=Oncorhynchus kisutch TaxID=8019 RepID=A0A8C7GM72_ONCKI